MRDRFADDLAHRHARVEARIGVLKDDLHPTPQRPERALREVRDVVAVEHHPPEGRLDAGAASAGRACSCRSRSRRRAPCVSPRRTRIDTPSTARTKRSRRASKPPPCDGVVLGDAVGRDEGARAGPHSLGRAGRCGRRRGRSLEQRVVPAHGETSAARQQRESLAGPTGARSGSSRVHFSMRIGQRSAKRHPGGRLRRSGTSPSMACSRRPAPAAAGRGMLSRRPRVYGCMGRAKISRTGALRRRAPRTSRRPRARSRRRRRGRA